ALMSAMTSFEQSMSGTDPFGTATPDTPTSPDSPAPTPAPTPAPEPDLSGIEQLKIVDLDLTITDKSFVNLILGASGMFGAGDPETLRNDIVNMVKGLGPDLTSSGLDTSVANELTDAVSKFLERPGSLNIKLKPAEPLSLGATNAKLDKQSLGFSASFTPGPAAPAAPKPN